MGKVYIKINLENIVISLDGGYTEDNIHDIENWILIDEGEGDRFNLCQSHYLDDALMNDNGVYNYKFVDGIIVHRTQEEIDADTQDDQTEQQPTVEDLINAFLGVLE